MRRFSYVRRDIPVALGRDVYNVALDIASRWRAPNNGVKSTATCKDLRLP